MTTRHDVERVRKEHPEWGYGEIAKHLDCLSAYVRKTFYRQKWPNPKGTPAPAPAPRARVKVKIKALALEITGPGAGKALGEFVQRTFAPAPPPENPPPIGLRIRDDKQSRRAERHSRYLRTGDLD
jgi:hypothetical protein